MKKTFSESDIWPLLISKDFSSLTEEERIEVLRFMSASEYADMRKLKLELGEYMKRTPQEIGLPPSFGKEIFKQASQKRQSWVRRLASYQVPAWKAAAAAACVALTFFSLGYSTTGFNESWVPVSREVDTLIGVSLAEDSSLSKFLIEAL